MEIHLHILCCFTFSRSSGIELYEHSWCRRNSVVWRKDVMLSEIDFFLIVVRKDEAKPVTSLVYDRLYSSAINNAFGGTFVGF